MSDSDCVSDVPNVFSSSRPLVFSICCFDVARILLYNYRAESQRDVRIKLVALQSFAFLFADEDPDRESEKERPLAAAMGKGALTKR